MSSPTLEKLDVSNSDSLESWHKRFEFYCKTNKNVTKENKIAFYFTLAGKEAYDLLVDLCYPDEPDGKSIDDLKLLLKNHLMPTNFETVERAKFNRICRNTHEPLKSFLLRVQQQAAKCNFGDQLKIQLRDRLVAGLNLPEVERKILAEKNLTYDIVKEIFEAHHNIHTAVPDKPVMLISRSHVQGSSKKVSVFHKKPEYKNTAQSSKPAAKPTSQRNCFSCGGDHLRKDCKFRKAVFSVR